jgi:hypothetical protein
MECRFLDGCTLPTCPYNHFKVTENGKSPSHPDNKALFPGKKIVTDHRVPEQEEIKVADLRELLNVLVGGLKEIKEPEIKEKIVIRL